MERELIHKGYLLLIAYIIFFGGLAWNYQSTWEHNRLVARYDELKRHKLMLLPPPQIRKA